MSPEDEPQVQQSCLGRRPPGDSQTWLVVQLASQGTQVGVRVAGRGAGRVLGSCLPLSPLRRGCEDSWTGCRGCEHSGQRAVGLQLVLRS